MQLEVGKFYKTRDGRKVGPIEFRGGELKCFATAEGPFSKSGHWYTQFNEHYPEFSGRSSISGEHQDDLIEEWRDEPKSPIQEEVVTKRKLVPGEYGRIFVDGAYGETINLAFITSMGKRSGIYGFTAQELEEASHILAQLAEFLKQENN